VWQYRSNPLAGIATATVSGTVGAAGDAVVDPLACLEYSTFYFKL